MMGGMYTGQWRNGMRDGWGKLVKGDGEVYQVGSPIVLGMNFHQLDSEPACVRRECGSSTARLAES